MIIARTECYTQVIGSDVVSRPILDVCLWPPLAGHGALALDVTGQLVELQGPAAGHQALPTRNLNTARSAALGGCALHISAGESGTVSVAPCGAAPHGAGARNSGTGAGGGSCAAAAAPTLYVGTLLGGVHAIVAVDDPSDAWLLACLQAELAAHPLTAPLGARRSSAAAADGSLPSASAALLPTTAPGKGQGGWESCVLDGDLLAQLLDLPRATQLSMVAARPLARRLARRPELAAKWLDAPSTASAAAAAADKHHAQGAAEPPASAPGGEHGEGVGAIVGSGGKGACLAAEKVLHLLQQALHGGPLM